MKKFTFPLDSLLRYRRHRRDLCCQLLAQVLAEQQRLEQHRRGLELQRAAQLGELRTLGEAGEVDIDRSASRRFHASQLLNEIHLTERNRRAVAEQAALCRQAVTQADQDVEVLERLREKQRQEHQYEEARRESRALDDAWMAVHLSRESR